MEYQGNRYEPFCAQEMSVACVLGKKLNTVGGDSTIVPSPVCGAR